MQLVEAVAEEEVAAQKNQAWMMEVVEEVLQAWAWAGG